MPDPSDKLSRSIALLRDVEWGGECADWGAHCPSCGAYGSHFEGKGRYREPIGFHAKDCELAAFLKEVEDA